MTEELDLKEKMMQQVGRIGIFKVASKTSQGIFLDWGFPKNLFLPFAEQAKDLEVGEEVLIIIYIDNTERIAASMRIDKLAKKRPLILNTGLKEGQEVELLIYMETDLGYKAVINGYHLGIIYASDVFQQLSYCQIIPGYINKIRPDGKIDLTLQKPGRDGTREIETQILAALKEQDGFLAITDKTEAETIYKQFGVSKKKFKIALGSIYKKRKIRIEENGIYLVSAPALKS